MLSLSWAQCGFWQRPHISCHKISPQMWLFLPQTSIVWLYCRSSGYFVGLLAPRASVAMQLGLARPDWPESLNIDQTLAQISAWAAATDPPPLPFPYIFWSQFLHLICSDINPALLEVKATSVSPFTPYAAPSASVFFCCFSFLHITWFGQGHSFI